MIRRVPASPRPPAVRGRANVETRLNWIQKNKKRANVERYWLDFVTNLQHLVLGPAVYVSPDNLPAFLVSPQVTAIERHLSWIFDATVLAGGKVALSARITLRDWLLSPQARPAGMTFRQAEVAAQAWHEAEALRQRAKAAKAAATTMVSSYDYAVREGLGDMPPGWTWWVLEQRADKDFLGPALRTTELKLAGFKAVGAALEHCYAGSEQRAMYVTTGDTYTAFDETGQPRVTLWLDADRLSLGAGAFPQARMQGDAVVPFNTPEGQAVRALGLLPPEESDQFMEHHYAWPVRAALGAVIRGLQAGADGTEESVFDWEDMEHVYGEDATNCLSWFWETLSGDYEPCDIPRSVEYRTAGQVSREGVLTLELTMWIEGRRVSGKRYAKITPDFILFNRAQAALDELAVELLEQLNLMDEGPSGQAARVSVRRQP